MIPVVGAALAYVPLALIFFANNQNWQGFFILIYSLGVIGTVDQYIQGCSAEKKSYISSADHRVWCDHRLKLFALLDLSSGHCSFLYSYYW